VGTRSKGLNYTKLCN